MTDEVKVAIADGIHTIGFNRVAKKNALYSAMYVALRHALEAAERNPAVAVHVFAGAPGVFTAGNDIGEFLKGGAGLAQPTVDFLRLLPMIEKPMLAAVDGLAVGIGTTLLLHCDLAYATPRATFRTPFLDLGVVPEAGSSLLAPRRLGHHRAFELLVLGATWSAAEAERYGLVNAVVPEAELASRVRETALKLAAKPPAALAAARRLMKGDAAAVLAQVDAEVALFAERLASPEAKEAFAAFLEKRPPRFDTGR